jgi:hypothetical protein
MDMVSGTFTKPSEMATFRTRTLLLSALAYLHVLAVLFPLRAHPRRICRLTEHKLPCKIPALASGNPTILGNRFLAGQQSCVFERSALI